MSDSYYPNYPDSAGTQVLPPHPTPPPVDHGPPPVSQPAGYPYPGGYPGNGFRGNNGRPSSSLGSLSTGMRAILVVLVGVSLALGAYAVMAHSDVGAARTKVADLSTSLQRTEESLSAKQAQLEQTLRDLEAANKSADSTAASLETATTCAKTLHEAWAAAFAEDYERADELLTAAEEPCDRMYADAEGADAQ